MSYEEELEQLKQEFLVVFAFLRMLGKPISGDSDKTTVEAWLQRLRAEDANLLSAQKLMREDLTPEKESQVKEFLAGTMLDGLDLQEFIAADTIKKRMKWIAVNSPLNPGYPGI
jgi:hypothetical protein